MFILKSKGRNQSQDETKRKTVSWKSTKGTENIERKGFSQPHHLEDKYEKVTLIWLYVRCQIY